jgi:hypothetical protein
MVNSPPRLRMRSYWQHERQTDKRLGISGLRNQSQICCILAYIRRWGYAPACGYDPAHYLGYGCADDSPRLYPYSDVYAAAVYVSRGRKIEENRL